jgi:hypothetical protein
MGKKKPQTSFLAGRIEGLKLGASKKKHTKWMAIKNGKMGNPSNKALKKMSGKDRKNAEKRMQKKNHGRRVKG